MRFWFDPGEVLNRIMSYNDEMADEYFGITIEPGMSRPLVIGTCRYEDHGFMDFYLKRASRIEKKEIVFSFEGVRRDMSEWDHSAIIVLNNGTYRPAICIAAGPQGRLGILDKNIDITPDARAFLDSIIGKLTLGEEMKFN